MIVVFLSEWRKLNMALVGIVMGSDSDMPVMAKAADILDKLGISYEMTIISAHREPDVFFEYAKTAEQKDSRLSLQEQEWQHICQECVRQYSLCQLLVFQCTQLL